MTIASARDTIGGLMNDRAQHSRPDPSMGAPFVLRDRSAIAAWVFIAIWMGVLALITVVMTRHGPHLSQPAELQYGVLAVFWLVGIPASAQMLASPCRRLEVDRAGGVTIHRRSPLTREVETFPSGSVSVELRPGRDDEGDTVWRITLVARDGRERLARAGRVREDEEAIAERLRAALTGPLAESNPPA